MSEKVAVGILFGAVKVSISLASPIVNSKAGKKFFGILPGELILASLDGFNKICDAFEHAGKNVMSTSSEVTIGLVSHKYGEEARKAMNEGLDAAGHALGTAWAVKKIEELHTSTTSQQSDQTSARPNIPIPDDHKFKSSFKLLRIINKKYHNN
ncbi:Senescence/dehydration-associated protein At3g51250 [Linum grandiflorum]